MYYIDFHISSMNTSFQYHEGIEGIETINEEKLIELKIGNMMQLRKTYLNICVTLLHHKIYLRKLLFKLNTT